MGIGGALGWLASMITGSILMTWLFNSTRGSVLCVALFHGTLDIAMTSPVSGGLMSMMGAVITVWGVAIPFVYGRLNLSRSAAYVKTLLAQPARKSDSRSANA